MLGSVQPPAISERPPIIGVAVSTHRRPAVLAKALAGWASAKVPHLIVVTHDADGAGVAVTKNRGIATLMDAGVDHLFLADDDVWPIRNGWWKPYVRSPQPHLMHCWGRSRYITETDGLTLWTWPRGILLYATRDVIARVGGMRPEFGRWGGEHAEWSRRIHNAGFTRAPFQDAAAARHGVWHCEDYGRSTPSSVPNHVRNSEANTRRRHALYDTYRDNADFVPYR